MKNHNESRRKFARNLVYIAPAILTLKAQPAFATSGSGGGGTSKRDRIVQLLKARRERRREFFARFFR